MKTNIVPMGQFMVEQRTDNGMFNATSIVKEWNDSNNGSKSVAEFIHEQMAFDKSFKGYTNIRYEDTGKDIWMCLSHFGHLLIYLDNEVYKEYMMESAFNTQFNELFKNYTTFPEYAMERPIEKRYTYIVTDSSGMYKIGSSYDPKKRIKSLAIGNPTISVVLVIDGDVEKELHGMFESQRVKGEWFGFHAKDIEYIRDNYKTIAQ